MYAKEQTNWHIKFLSANFSVSFLLLTIMPIAIVAILPHIPQQQAMAGSMKAVTIGIINPINTKPSINSNINNNNNNNNFLSYQNRAFGITIQYPPSWQKIDGEIQGKVEGERHISKSLPDQASSDEQVVEFVSPLERSSDKYQEALSISIHTLHTKNIGEFFGLFDKPTAQKISLHGFILSHITSLITKLPSFDLIESESGHDEITLADGSLGHKIVYTYMGQEQNSNSNTQLKVMEVLTIKHDIGYIIRYSSEPDKYYSYLPTIQKMINSFRIMTT